MADFSKTPAVQRRADAVIVVSQQKGLHPKAAADRIETLVCSHCMIQMCKTCPVEGMISKLQAKEAWD